MTEKIYIRKDRWVGVDGAPLPFPWIIGKGAPVYDWTHSRREPYATQAEALAVALVEAYGN